MARKQDRKAQKKRLKERKKTASRSKVLAARRIAHQYPRFIIDPAGGDPPFVAAVRGLIDQFRFEDDSCCSAELRGSCKLLRQHGITKLRSLAHSAQATGFTGANGLTGDVAYLSLLSTLVNGLGDWLFRMLPERYTKNPLPNYYYHVEPVDDALRISFRFLSSVRMPEFRGPVFYSPLEPSVELGGGSWKVCFIDHVLERACERIASTRPITYPAFQGCQLYFENCVYYEPVTLPSGQEAVRLWHFIGTSQHADYVSELAGEQARELPQEQWCFNIGYCPLQIVRLHAVGITLLFPGYRNTPEADLVNRASIPRHLREQLRQAADDNTLARLMNKETLEVMRWYHENGIPQVRILDRPLTAAAPRLLEWNRRCGW